MTTTSRKSKSAKDEALPAGVRRKWAWHYRALMGLRKRLSQDERSRLQEVSSADETAVDGGDRGNDEIERSLSLRLLGSDEAALGEIDAALERLRRNTYGICEATGRPIPLARLKAIPWCRYIQDVAARRERAASTATKSRF